MQVLHCIIRRGAGHQPDDRQIGHQPTILIAAPARSPPAWPWTAIIHQPDDCRATAFFIAQWPPESNKRNQEYQMERIIEIMEQSLVTYEIGSGIPAEIIAQEA